MNIFEIIDKSQKKIKLSKDEIHWLVNKFTKDQIPDYQMSTWLATVFLNQLSDEETSWLTEALCDSGEKINWPYTTVDKHSTGGVGDKTSLIIAPLVASLGYKVPMMAGRGLGHTGGTIDKLESIGFQTNIDVKNFKSLVDKHGTCIMGQSADFCPADKRLYALRDATYTVANTPLICSSIMSKKIAEGLNGLVLDVKFGTGAFMNQLEDARNLAKKLISIGEKSKIKTFGVLSSMNQPLGRYIGNKLELLECIEIMKDPNGAFEKYEDNILLSLLLSALMLQSLNPKSSLDKNFQIVFDQLMSGRVFDKFVEIVNAQGGSLSDFIQDNPSKTRNGLNPIIKSKKMSVTSTSSGLMNYTNIKNLGFAAVALGAGRFTKDDVIDFEVGFYCYKKQGDYIKNSEAIFDVYYNDETKLSNALEILKSSFEINDSNLIVPTKNPDTTKSHNFSHLINEIISFDGSKFQNIHLKTNFFEV